MFSLVIKVNQQDYSSKEEIQVQKIRQRGKAQATATPAALLPCPSTVPAAQCTPALATRCRQSSAGAAHTLDAPAFLVLDHTEQACLGTFVICPPPGQKRANLSLRLNVTSSGKAIIGMAPNGPPPCSLPSTTGTAPNGPPLALFHPPLVPPPMDHPLALYPPPLVPPPTDHSLALFPLSLVLPPMDHSLALICPPLSHVDQCLKGFHFFHVYCLAPLENATPRERAGPLSASSP